MYKRQFGISAEGRAEALNNRINAASNITGIPENLPEGSFGISEAGAREALTNRIESQTGIPANLPEGSFGITPKKKFNVPKINKVIRENKIDALGNSTTIEYENTFPQGQTSFSGQESTIVETDGNKVTVTKRKTITQRIEGKSYFDFQTGQAFILGVEVSQEGYSEWNSLPLRESVKRAEEFANRYRK